MGYKLRESSRIYLYMALPVASFIILLSFDIGLSDRPLFYHSLGQLTDNQINNNSTNNYRNISNFVENLNLPYTFDLMTFDPKNNIFYVIDNDEPFHIGKINASNNQQLPTRPLFDSWPGDLTGIFFNPFSNDIFLASEFQTIYVIDGEELSIKDNITLPYTNNTSNLGPLAIYYKTNEIYVIDKELEIVYVIDGNSKNVTHKIRLPESSPESMELDQNSNMVYIPNYMNNSISIINGFTKQLKTIDVADRPSDIAIDSQNDNAYVISEDGERVSVVDLTKFSLQKPIIIPTDEKFQGDVEFEGTESTSIVVDPKNALLYIADAPKGLIYIVNQTTNSVSDHLFLGDPLIDLFFNPINNKIYALNGNNRLTIIDIDFDIGYSPKNIHESIVNDNELELDLKPYSVAVNEKANRVYIADLESGILNIIDGFDNEIIKSISIANQTERQVEYGYGIDNDHIAFVKDDIFIVDEERNKISIINGTTLSLSKEIEMEKPSQIRFDEEKNWLYIVNEEKNSTGNCCDVSLSIIDASNLTALKRIDVEYGMDFSIDSSGDTIVIFNYGYEPSPVYLVRDFLGSDTKVLEVSRDLVRDFLGSDTKVLEVSPDSKQEKILMLRLYDEGFANDLSINKNTGVFYLANPELNTIYYLDPLLSSRLNGTINAGSIPSAIAINEKNDKIYVANRGEDTISVIDGLTNNLTKKIPLKNKPDLVAINTLTNVVYVFHVDTNSYSIIDGNADELVVGTRYDVTPKDSGHIICSSNEIPINRHIMLPLNTNCSAEPNSGYSFSHWSQNLGQNSSITLTEPISTNSFLGFLNDFPFGDSDNSNLNIGKNGNFTANFQSAPPPIPPEFWIPLYGIIASSVVGWSIPSIIAWINAKRKGRTSDDYHKRIIELYNDGKLDYADSEALNKIRNDLSATYAKGKISEHLHQNLKEEIGVLYEEIHRKRIDYLNSYPIKHDTKDDRLVATIRRDIDEDFAKGKITEQHYNLLNKKIESIVNTDENKKSKLHNVNET